MMAQGEDKVILNFIPTRVILPLLDIAMPEQLGGSQVLSELPVI